MNNNRGLEEVVWVFTNAYVAPLVWLEPCLYWTIYKLPFEVFASWNHLLSEAPSITWDSGQLPWWHCGKTQWFKSTVGGVRLRDCVIHLCHLLATWHSTSYLMPQSKGGQQIYQTVLPSWVKALTSENKNKTGSGVWRPGFWCVLVRDSYKTESKSLGLGNQGLLASYTLPRVQIYPSREIVKSKITSTFLLLITCWMESMVGWHAYYSLPLRAWSMGIAAASL